MSWNGDAIVIGSGFGGAMAAHALVHSGHRVLMIERGSWVGRGPDDADFGRSGLASRHYSMEAPYDVTAGRKHYKAGSWSCVGGPSVFYGAASYRFRPRDFEHHQGIVADSGAAWPFRYNDLEPYYSAAERLLRVAGDAAAPEPPRSAPYPQAPAPLAKSSRAIADAAKRLGMTPSRIPLAISYTGEGDRMGCMRCGRCDGYACFLQAKNDLSTMLIPSLVRQGMELRTNTVCVRLVRAGSRIDTIECVHRETGAREVFTAPVVIVAAGALATPHLLLASELDRVNPAGDSIGRYLTRHRNAVVFGAFAHRPNPHQEFDKHIAILDFYDAAGCIQQLTPAEGLVRAYLPPLLRTPAAIFLSHASGLLVIAEDQPRPENRVTIDPATRDKFGLPRLSVRHAYTPRDEEVAKLLVTHAKRVLREAGAKFTLVHPIETWSHALGTVRMGNDAATAPLDAHGRFRGLDNLYVVDGSALPRSASLNPSLTISANALRVAAHIAQASIDAPDRAVRSLPVWHSQPALETH
jgi:choline dehydrogenase-like flavoprotein